MEVTHEDGVPRRSYVFTYLIFLSKLYAIFPLSGQHGVLIEEPCVTG